MPPTFLYFVAYLVWIPLACLVWLVAGVMAFRKSSRVTARCLAVAMAGTFPGVFLFQIAAAPVVIAILVGVRLFWKALEPGPGTTTANPAVILVGIIGITLILAIMLAVSVAGFYEGWRMGWSWARGRRLSDAWREGPVFWLGRKVLSRPARERTA